jgi:hypothetical protein
MLYKSVFIFEAQLPYDEKMVIGIVSLKDTSAIKKLKNYFFTKEGQMINALLLRKKLL